MSFSLYKRNTFNAPFKFYNSSITNLITLAIEKKALFTLYFSEQHRSHLIRVGHAPS